MMQRYSKGLPFITLVILLLCQSAPAETEKRIAPQEIAPIKAPFDMPQLERPVFEDRALLLTDYGAVGDGKSKNTDAFAKAITACHRAGGGKVIVPPGKWLTGAIHLQSHVNLVLEKGAEIHFSQDPEDYLPMVFTRWAGFECYNYSPLIYARDCENIAITGEGKLYGHGQSWWPWSERQSETGRAMYENQVLKGVPPEQRIYGTPEAGLRPQMISPINCKNVLLEGFTIADPGPFWTIQMVYCENVIVRNLDIHTKGGPNTDGINLDSSSKVLIEYCHLDVGDDAVCLKSGINKDGWRVGRPTEKVVVRNITALSSHGGIVIGSEMSGGVRDVLAYDCLFDGSDRGIRLKSNAARGGTVENIHYRNITMRNIRSEAIRINTNYGAWLAAKDASAYPVFRNIIIKDIDCQGAGIAASLRGTSHMPIRDIRLENVTVSAEKGMSFEWVHGLDLINVRCEPETGDPMFFKNCQDVNNR